MSEYAVIEVSKKPYPSAEFTEFYFRTEPIKGNVKAESIAKVLASVYSPTKYNVRIEAIKGADHE